MSELNLAKFLGPNSYPAILDSINARLMESKADTLTGNDLLQEYYQKLNESATPVLTLKEFTTKAEKVAGDDAKLKDIIDFCRKQVTSGDFNFLLNFCKEEKWAEASRAFHPSPKDTLKEFEEYFTAQSSVIEQGIKAGIFDSMKSNLLNKIKVDLTGIQNLNESTNDVLTKGDLVRYSPIGVKLHDMKNNRVVLLMESAAIEYKDETYTPLNESDASSLEIPTSYRQLMGAIQSLPYDPSENTFTLNESWDFPISLDVMGVCRIGEKVIDKKDLPNLFLESVNLYESTNSVQGFNRVNYMRDADNFILLANNSNKLIKFDTLETIKNISESGYIILDKSSITFEPKIIASSAGVKLFESFNDLALEAAKILGSPVNELFESQILDEQQKIEDRFANISKLNESIDEINGAILKVRNLKVNAHENSPAFEKLTEQENQLNVKLNESLEELNHYKNEFKLH